MTFGATQGRIGIGPHESPTCSRRLLLVGGALMAAGLGRSDRGFAMENKEMTGNSGYATVDGLRVYYELHGGAPDAGETPVVLLHGGMMSIDTAFADDLLPRLAGTRPVIAIEQQGHGHTADREGPAKVDRMVDDTAGVLTHLGIRQAHFVGHSLGGMIALGMAVRHPDLVRSITPISATYTLEGMLPELVQMQRNPAHQPSADLIPLLPTEADFIAWQASYQRNAPDPAVFDRVLAKLNKMLAEWEGWSQAELRAVRAPALLVIGDNDFVRIEHAAEMARLIPDAQLAVLPGTTHMNIIDRGAWLMPLIEARLESS
ncbi:alpha/beta fold hydrolase [Rhodospirillaceae bacterium SYSU D60014]|uniref:alpha/beta fold hydrolase n=1 Tax=Virgifigura deserti TaxID=2268457 RepID=UPI000E6638A3